MLECFERRDVIDGAVGTGRTRAMTLLLPTILELRDFTGRLAILNSQEKTHAAEVSLSGGAQPEKP